MKTLSAVALALFSQLALALDWAENQEVQQLFADAGVSGTFVLFDAKEARYIGFNRKRAEKRYIPASTFKVANTLIGLAEGAVADVDEVVPYGGKPQPFASWEKDMSLRDALKISNVPVYQELARRTGLSRMAVNIRELNYGNADIGASVDSFWLQGPLMISAIEQVDFLAGLAAGDLAFKPAIQKQVREITLIEQGEGWSLHAKTGWGDATEPDIGWWVGWVEKDGSVFSFAVNMDVVDTADAAKRIALGRRSLEILGVL